MPVLEKVSYVYQSTSNLQEIATFFHNGNGVFALLFAIFLLLSIFGHHRKNFFVIAMPIIVIFESVLFLLYGFFGPGFSKFLITAQVLFAFPEFYIHIVMAAVAIFASSIELSHIFRKIKNRLSLFAFPAMFITNGYLFILHPHSRVHDENVMFSHTVFGSLLIFVGIMLLIQRLDRNHRWETISTTELAAAALIILAILLVQFKEPALAYQAYFPIEESGFTTLEANNEAIIYITANGVVPQNIKIKKGGQITFYQVDASWHDIASGPHPTHTEYPPLNIGFLKQGQSHTVTFTEAGVFGFHDHIHENDTKLQGIIEVNP